MSKDQVGTLERRWNEGIGERYMADGKTIRCQGVARGRLRQRREEIGDPNLTAGDMWPELQCVKSVVPGTFGCKWHNGEGEDVELADYVPTDMLDKMRVLTSDPGYMNRQLEINHLRARNMQIFEEIDDMPFGGAHTAREILSGLKKIEKGDIVEGSEQIRSALSDRNREDQLWSEYRLNTGLIKDLTATQTKTAVAMRTAMTVDQAHALVDRMTDDFIHSLETHITDPDLIQKVLIDVFNSRRDVGAASRGTLLSADSGGGN